MTDIAFLGLGRMGLPMAARLTRAGHRLTVWNRTPAKAEVFAARHGAASAATPAECVTDAEVVITMLADDDALMAAYTGPGGALDRIAPGTLAIDMGTVSPDTVRRLRHLLAGRRADLVDAPVSGSVQAATAATLTVMAAGDTDAVERARPLLSQLGDPVMHLGPSGSGSVMKLAVNSVVHSLNEAVSEALVLAERAGVPREAAYAVLLNSAVAAPFVGYKQAAFERPGETPVGFSLDLAAKDLRLATALADRVGAPVPQTRAALDVLGRASAAGFGDADESAVAVFLRTLCEQTP
ncbi:NAD(P)-dependent oxidoreductase [Streptomyces sp. NPDC047000]|uniref:NAD(P)-dependent oxidoreductase n=1 Tax=Streptomyces sp. NPDC047000 TaxID=3155474 RepID=UPI0033D9A68F